MKLNFKEKYLIVLVALCLISVGFYYSYAIFVTKQLQENVVVVKLDNRVANVKIDGKDNKVKISKETDKEIKLSFQNPNKIEFHYLVIVNGIKTGVKVSSNDDVTGLINANETKEITIRINNTDSEDVELTFNVKLSNKEIIDNDVNYSYINKEENYDHSNANKPELTNLKLIPVTYEKASDTEGSWVKASSNNSDSLWYDYDNGLWANAVLVTNNSYQKYLNATIGTEIEVGDILGYYVWIPRFKYYIINNSNYTNYERMSNIVFEKGNATTGTIECSDKISNSETQHVYSEVCKDTIYNHIYDNLSTYTHPAFKEGNGFWVAKFLMGEGEKVLPNVNILKKDIKGAYSVSNSISKSHVLTNMEYAAIVLLSNSAYGKTGNSLYLDKNSANFARIYVNAYAYDVTGCSSEYNNYSKSFLTTETKKCIEYNDLTNLSHVSNSVNYAIGYAGAGASSTGTVYGVYDLASKNGELVSSYLANKEGTVLVPTNYYDVYSYSEYTGNVASSSNVYNINRYKLGDAIKEHFRTFNKNGMWYSGMLTQNKESGVMIRGGNGEIENASVYTTLIESTDYVAPFRVVLIP